VGVALNRKGGRWLGGYVSLADSGAKTYVIERSVAGERFHISTRCRSERAALKHLERFETDARAYRDNGVAGMEAEEGIYLTAELVLAYRDWMLTRPRPSTRKHANEMAHRLADWADDLSGVDLRKVTLRDHLKRALARREGSHQHRIIAIKGLYSWLRKERGLLTSGQDSTLDLAVPQATPEKHRRRKAVPIEVVRKVLELLAPAYRDCLLLLANTGWHVTELARFASQPESRIAAGAGEVLAVLQVRHKTGDTTRTPLVSGAALDAAKRIRQRGCLPRKLNGTLKDACRLAKVSPFGAGVLRHSVATWAIESGTPADRVAEFLGHKSKSTTLRFYADVAVPSAVVIPPKLG
jgi:integrase